MIHPVAARALGGPSPAATPVFGRPGGAREALPPRSPANDNRTAIPLGAWDRLSSLDQVAIVTAARGGCFQRRA